MTISNFLVGSIDSFASDVKISNLFFSKQFKVLITTILSFKLLILIFHLYALINRLFFFDVFSDIFKKSSIFTAKLFFRIWLGRTSLWVAKNIILVFFVYIVNTENEVFSRCVLYPGENIIESFIILSKTPCFSIHRQSRIIEK